MIAVSIHPDEIAADQPTDVTLCFTNTGSGPCTNVRFTFRVPREILLIRGRRQVQIARLRKGEQHDHPLQVQAREQGTFKIVSTNFSYRDSAGRGRRVPETVLPLRAVAPAVPISAPVPILELTLETTHLPVRAWSPLSGHITNVGEVAAWGMTLSASGRALASPKGTLGDLPSGETLYFTLSVRAAEVGTRVPIRLEATFRDVSGQLHHRSWRAHLAIEDVQPVVSKPEIRMDDIKSYIAQPTPVDSPIASEEPFSADEERALLRQELAHHKRNLYKLRQKKAQYGIDVPISVLNQIEDEEREIARIEAKVKSLVESSKGKSTVEEKRP